MAYFASVTSCHFHLITRKGFTFRDKQFSGEVITQCVEKKTRRTSSVRRSGATETFLETVLYAPQTATHYKVSLCVARRSFGAADSEDKRPTGFIARQFLKRHCEETIV